MFTNSTSAHSQREAHTPSLLKDTPDSAPHFILGCAYQRGGKEVFTASYLQDLSLPVLATLCYFVSLVSFQLDQVFSSSIPPPSPVFDIR